MLEELMERSEAASEPQVIAASDISIGGVDPLGLRQINFDMMDQVLPSLNNVARHIQPFLFMTWAWRRAEKLTAEHGTHSVSELRDFVDRLETIYVWSQFLAKNDTDLPGGQALAGLMQLPSYRFGGDQWDRFRDVRRYSTGLIAAVNYGPLLRNMEWIIDLADIPDSGIKVRGAYKANPTNDAALEAALVEFETQFASVLSHPAFNELGAVTVTLDEAQSWGRLWRMTEPSEAVQRAAWRRMLSGAAGPVREKGFELVKFAASSQSEQRPSETAIRRKMADTSAFDLPVELLPYATAWRRVQVRQVFRLALEGLLHWCQLALVGPRTTSQLASLLVAEAGAPPQQQTAREWTRSFTFSNDPTLHLEELGTALAEREGFAKAFLNALCFCVAEAPGQAETFERSERLPLIKAARDWVAWEHFSPEEFIGRIIEGWIFAQHTYWSVGRGLQDARSNGKTILRMRIFIDEGGWRLADGFNPGAPPNATPDRLGTAISLMTECGEL